MDLDRTLVRPGAVIGFADSGGHGAVVVLTHGAGVDSSVFDAQAAALVRAGFRVVVWDLRGHGRSTLADGVRFTGADALDDLGALLVETGVARPVLVGHSLGGNLIQAFERRSPDRVGGIVVVDAAWNEGPLRRIDRLALRVASPALAAIPAGRLPRLMARASASTPAAVDRAEGLFRRMPKARFLEVWSATAAFLAPDPHPRFPERLALVRGADDRTGDIATAMPRWAAAAGVHEHVIPGAGHIPMWDAPDRTSSTLLAILEGWDPASRI